MRPTLGGWPGLSLLLLGALLACSHLAAGHSIAIANNTEVTTIKPGTTIKPEETTIKPEETTIKPEETTIKPEETTIKPEETTIKPEETTVNTEETTINTEETTVNTEETTINTEETTINTDSSTPTGDTSPPTTPTPAPPLDDLTLYERTKNELNNTAWILEKCSSLVSSKESSTGSLVDRPAGWWRLGKEQTAEEKPLAFNEFCNDASVCGKLQTGLSDIEDLLEILTDNVDLWKVSNLEDLKLKNVELNAAYEEANANTNFKTSIDQEKFKDTINKMEADVRTSQDNVDTKISDIQRDRTGSVVLVAVIGSIGGIMIVSLAGVMIYSATKQKMKKKSSTTPYNKLQGENIPIDAFLSDSPRADPYANQPPPPQTRNDPYPSSYGGRGEPMPRVTRVGKGLPRTHF